MLIFRFYRNLHLRIVHHQLFGEQMLCGPCNDVGNGWIVSPSSLALLRGESLQVEKFCFFGLFLSREICNVYIYHNATCMRKMKYIWVFPKMVVPPKHPKMVIFSRKTHGCWVPPFLVGNPHFRLFFGKIKNSKKTCGVILGISLNGGFTQQTHWCSS